VRKRDLLQEEELEKEEEEPDRLTLLLPQSKFDCTAKKTGYYADDGLNCEVFHYCQDNARHSWICPEGFLFHQARYTTLSPHELLTQWHTTSFCVIIILLCDLLRFHDSLPRFEPGISQIRNRNCCFVFGKHRVQISARIPAILTGFRGDPHSLQANAGIVS
jgi:hypothetical protein